MNKDGYIVSWLLLLIMSLGGIAFEVAMSSMPNSSVAAGKWAGAIAAIDSPVPVDVALESKKVVKNSSVSLARCLTAVGGVVLLIF